MSVSLLFVAVRLGNAAVNCQELQEGGPAVEATARQLNIISAIFLSQLHSGTKLEIKLNESALRNLFNMGVK